MKEVKTSGFRVLRDHLQNASDAVLQKQEPSDTLVGSAEGLTDYLWNPSGYVNDLGERGLRAIRSGYRVFRLFISETR